MNIAAAARRTTVLAVAAAALAVGWQQPASATTSGQSSQVAQEKRVVALVNARRARVGCTPLRIDPRLVTAARRHSVDMAHRHYFNHLTPTGTTPWTRIARTGYPATTLLGENIAAGQTTADSVVKAWMASPSHRANILNCKFRAIGVGLASGGDYHTYWTQDFGGI